MKKNILIALCCVLSMMIFASCEKDQTAGKYVTFKASLENSGKTYLDGLSVKWVANDSISVVWGSAITNNNKFNLTEYNGNIATFGGTLTPGNGTKVCVVYPYNSSIKPNIGSYNSIIYTTLPSAQEAKAGGFDNNACIMGAKATVSSGTIPNITFRNLCALLKIKSPYNCSSIQIVSNNGERIAGTFSSTIYSSDATITTSSEEAGGSKSVRLSGEIEADNYYYIAVLPQTLARGFTIKFWGVQDNAKSTQVISYNTASNASITIARNNIYTIEGFSTTPETHIIPDEAVDLGLPSGTLWASSNIDTRTTSKLATNEYDFGQYFGWGCTTAHNDNESIYEYTDYSSADAGAQLCGSPWSTPTNTEFRELMTECTWTWTTSNNVAGYRITGPNGNSIFLPLASKYFGRHQNEYSNWIYTFTSPTANDNSYYSYYWTKSHADYDNTGSNVSYFRFSSSTMELDLDSFRSYLFPIRPVCHL